MQNDSEARQTAAARAGGAVGVDGDNDGDES